MFNKSKKYGIVKCLPFVCFANINAGEAFISGKDQIKFIVNGEEYVLQEGVKILEDNKEEITLEKLLKESENNITVDSIKDQILPLVIEDINDGTFKLINFKIGGNIVSNDLGDLNNVKGIDVVSKDLIITFEGVYKLEEGSKLSDGKNELDIKGKEILDSELRPIDTVEKFFIFINNKFAEDKFTSNGKSCLSGKKGAEIDKNKFFISKFIENVFFDNRPFQDYIIYIKNMMRMKFKLTLEISPYINYEIENIKLSDELAKTRITNVAAINNFKSTDLLKKQLKKLTYIEIESIINNSINPISVEINKQDENEIEEGNVSLEITEDDYNKFSDPMKGTIKFKIKDSKKSELTFEDGKGSDLLIKFGDKINSSSDKVVNTEMTQEEFKAELKTLFNVVDDTNYDVAFTNFNNTGNKAKNGFDVTVKFKNIVNGFTKKLDKTEMNVTVNLVIDDNSANQYELVNGLTATSAIAFKRALDYNNFITELEKKLGKGTGTLATAIKEVKYNNGKADTEWKSGEANNIEGLGIKSVTITLNKEENGNYVKKVVLTPPAKDTVTFTLNVTTSVNGYKVKAGNEKLTVTVPKASLNYNTLFNAIQSQIGDNKFKIMKGSSAIKNTDTIDIINTNAYSIELLQGSKFIEADNKDNKKDDNEDNKGEQTGDKSTEKKRCCGGGKCSGGDKREK